MRGRVIVGMVLGVGAAMTAVAAVTPTPTPLPIKAPTRERVYVQMHRRCRDVLTGDRLRTSPSASTLYTLLKRCVGDKQRRLLKRFPPNGYKGYYEELPLTNAFIVDVTEEQKLWLAKQKDVVDFVVPPTIITLPTPLVPTLQAERMCRPSSEANHRLAGIVIGIVDSGLDWSLESTRKHYRGMTDTGQVSHDYNWRDAYNGPSQSPCQPAGPCDTRIDRHGTSVSGVISAETRNDEAISYIHCRAAGSEDATDITLHACLNFFLAPTSSSGTNPRPDLAPDIINASLGGCLNVRPSACAMLDGAIDALSAGGILVVAAAGALNPTTHTYTANSLPALSNSALTIGGVGGAEDQPALSPSSPPGPDFDPCKPNFVIREPSYMVPSESLGLCYPLEGTSFNAPRITAAVARIWLNVPSLRHQRGPTLEFLKQSVIKPLPSLLKCHGNSADVPNREFGYGEIDVEKVNKALQLTPTPVSTTPTPTPTPTPIPTP